MKPIGGVVHPIYLHLLIDPLGYPTAIRWSALVIGVSAIAACTLMRTRLPRKEWDGKAVFFEISLFKHVENQCVDLFDSRTGLLSTGAEFPYIQCSLTKGASLGASVPNRDPDM
jgi:hypothetical protein